VQEALTFAIDRERIAALYGPTGSTTSNILVSPANLASPNTSFTFDPARAEELLDQSGWLDEDGDGIREQDGVEMSVVIQTTVTPLRQATQEIIKENLEAIGFEVIIKIIDGATFGNRAPENTNSAFHFYADLQMLFFGNRSPDPASYMDQWTCDQIPQAENGWAGLNIERWCSPGYDALLRQASSEIDPEARARLFVQMNDLLVNNVVMIPHGRESNTLPPRLDSIDPPEAFAGDDVTLTGRGLSGTNVIVRFGATNAPVGPQPFASRFSVGVPLALASGPVAVTVSVNGNDTNSLQFTVVS
jgi:peptide/nickel transport system substrate-binding protein